MRQLINIITILAFLWALSTAIILKTAFGADNKRPLVKTVENQQRIPVQMLRPIINRNGKMQLKQRSIIQPLRLKVTVLDSAEISLRWNKINCGGYRLEKKKNNGAFSSAALMASGDTSLIDTKVDPNTVYTYRVYTKCNGKDSYSNAVTINTGNNNPYTETVYCPSGVQQHLTTPGYGVWQGYNSTESVHLTMASTEDGGQQRLICRYTACPSCETVILSRLVPASSCRKTDPHMNEKSFKCKKGAF